MYRFPPLKARATVAHIAGAATAVVLAAPGGTFAYRIYGWSLYVNRLTAAAIVDIDLVETASGDIWAQVRGAQVAGTPGSELTYPWPGYQLASNQGITLSTTSTAATGNSIAIVYYYVDNVS